MSSKLTISATASQGRYGAGNHRVRGLAANELERVKAGERVFYKAERKSQLGTNGTVWRVVKSDGRKMYPRVPTPDEIQALRAQTGIV